MGLGDWTPNQKLLLLPGSLDTPSWLKPPETPSSETKEPRCHPESLRLLPAGWVWAQVHWALSAQPSLPGDLPGCACGILRAPPPLPGA